MNYNNMYRLIIYLSLIGLVFLTLMYLDSEAQELDVSYYEPALALDLVGDKYYDDLNILYPNKVEKFYDSYGVTFYAIDGVSKTYVYDEL